MRARRGATGVVVGELCMNRTCYYVLFDDSTTPAVYHKDFIKVLKEDA